MRRLIAIVTVCLFLAGCAASEPGSTLPPETPPAAHTQTPSSPAPPEPMPVSHYINNVYPGQLRGYYTALLEQWPEELYREMDMSPLGAAFRDADPLQCVGFALEDLDGDGYDELIIGQIGEGESGAVFEIWTAPGEEPVRIVKAGAGERYYLQWREDGTWALGREATGAAGEQIYRCYSLDSGFPDPELGVLRRNRGEEESDWFLTWGQEAAPANTLPVEEDWAEDFIRANRERGKHVAYYPFYLYNP